ncbi:hypothetical protein BDA96_04G180300 [Sorghum bicolor]|uniref:Uncharacterized protein n=1 Tax=Sorghum bicolor TaxID=4558 RepID=A0A921R3H6_SORBI|nr:hypothetical protein BDA96_04G180300 [Sorghum bicolor]
MELRVHEHLQVVPPVPSVVDDRFEYDPTRIGSIGPASMYSVFSSSDRDIYTLHY